MSPLEREHLLGLEPELRGSANRAAFPRRALSRPLVILMGTMRVYVAISFVLVVVTFVRVMHH